jgi:hypothetical protein
MHTHDQSIDGWKHFVELEYANTVEVQDTLHAYMMLLAMWSINGN